jgi:hypothetical protein
MRLGSRLPESTGGAEVTPSFEPAIRKMKKVEEKFNDEKFQR